MKLFKRLFKSKKKPIEPKRTKILRRYICDNCDKQTNWQEPDKKSCKAIGNWVSIDYSLSVWKEAEYKTFCCEKCLKDYMNKEIDKYLKEVK